MYFNGLYLPGMEAADMARILENEGKKMNFSRSYRASIDRIEGITFSVPDYDIQEKAMEQVVELEAKIAEFEKQLMAFDGKKSEILKSYLN
jgi:type I restriction enzyme M protein